MGPLTFRVLRCPHDEHRHAVEHSHALVAFFAIGFTCVLTGEQISIEESFQIGKVNTVILQIRPTLALVLRVHMGECICDTHMRQAKLKTPRPPWFNTCVSIIVVRTSGWPSNSCTVRIPYPSSSKGVAKEW